jgi:hypothetical protein
VFLHIPEILRSLASRVARGGGYFTGNIPSLLVKYQNFGKAQGFWGILSDDI